MTSIRPCGAPYSLAFLMESKSTRSITRCNEAEMLVEHHHDISVEILTDQQDQLRS